jgi:hypothetical protein
MPINEATITAMRLTARESPTIENSAGSPVRRRWKADVLSGIRQLSAHDEI